MRVASQFVYIESSPPVRVQPLPAIKRDDVLLISIFLLILCGGLLSPIVQAEGEPTNSNNGTSVTSVDHRTLSYTSYTLRQTAWSSEQYVGDLKDVVEIADATAHVVSFRSPRDTLFSIDISAAVRSNEEGDTELESIVGAVESGGMIIRLENSSAPGFVKEFDDDGRFNGKFIIGDRSFDASYTHLNIGVELGNDMGAHVGVGYIEVIQPAEIDIYTARSSGGFTGQPNYPESLVDPEYKTRLVGVWFEVDNLQAVMHDQSGFALSVTRSGSWRRALGLTMDITAGLFSGESSADLKKVMQDNYGLDLKYSEPVGVGWSASYKLEYMVVYKGIGTNVGVSFGLEGRVLQAFFDTEDITGESDSVEDGTDAVGRFGIGDNSVFHYGPFLRLAWDI